MLYHSTVRLYLCTLLPLFPWPCACDDKRCKSRTRRGESPTATEDMAAAGRVWRSPRFGCLGLVFGPGHLSCVRRGQGSTCRRAAHANSCLLAFASAPSTQPGFLSLLVGVLTNQLRFPVYGKPERLLGAPCLMAVPQCAPTLGQPHGNLRIRSEGSRAA